MTDSTFVYPTDARPARHFLRRAGAFVIDMLLFYALLVLPVALLYNTSGMNLGINSPLYTSCHVAESSALTRLVETEWPLANGESRINRICATSGWASPTQRFFISTVTSSGDLETSNRSASIPIDDNGNAIPLSFSWTASVGQALFQLLTMGLLIFASAMITADGRRTPGKALLSLRVIDASASVPSLKRCLNRETLKFLPVLVLHIAWSVLLVGGLTGLSASASGEFLDVIHAARDLQMSEFGEIFTVDTIGAILNLIWWFGPFIIWRGQSFYDRIAGCFVVRSGAASPATPT